MYLLLEGKDDEVTYTPSLNRCPFDITFCEIFMVPSTEQVNIPVRVNPSSSSSAAEGVPLARE
jgi:hypothetical protein